LMKKGVLLSTTEHLLAALYSCGVDNVYIDINAIEVPILDGSSQPFIEMLERAGVRRLRRRRRYLKVLRPLEISDGDRHVGIYPSNDFRVHCMVDYAHPAIGRQEIELVVNRHTFSETLARARTFGFLDEVEKLRAVDLIRGGSLENAIVLTRDGILNGELRYPDEFGRHKTLDLIGDLALVGRPLLARVVAHKAGHALHTQLVSRLLADASLWTETTADPAEEESAAPAYPAAEARAT
jgi:UDP-3-O-[3-hydroxymyristoyl] N-acetylglucosamine deacetylase